MPESTYMPDDRLIARVRGEYLEMPGLRLTSDQAGRLWGLEPQACRHVLSTLIEAGFLARGPDGRRYARRSDEVRTVPSLRMAAARLPIPGDAAGPRPHPSPRFAGDVR